jgi:hypothetical protein
VKLAIKLWISFTDPMKPLVWPWAAIPKKIIELLRAIAVATANLRPGTATASGIVSFPSAGNYPTTRRRSRPGWGTFITRLETNWIITAKTIPGWSQCVRRLYLIGPLFSLISCLYHVELFLEGKPHPLGANKVDCSSLQ